MIIMVKSQNTKIFKILKNKNFLYFFWGGINTLFSYLFSLTCLTFFIDKLSFIFLFLIINLICILFSFSTYAFFVFKIKANYLNSLFKFFISNIYLSIYSYLFLNIFLNYYNFEIIVVQSCLTITIVLKSFFIHNKFTFK